MKEKTWNGQPIYQEVDATGIETLRDKFAMAAMQGLLANGSVVESLSALIRKQGGNNFTIDKIIAKKSYEQADAMLEARKL